MTDGVSTRPDPAVRRWRLAVFAVYLAAGLAISAWLTRLPAISERLELGPAALGALLLTQTVAAFASVSTSGITVLRLGARRSLLVTALAVFTGLVVLGIGVSVLGSVTVTAIGMLLFGLGSATSNVAANVEGAALENALGRSIMPLMHGFFSIGTVLGAVIGSIATAAQVPVGWHVGAVAVVILVLMLVALPRLLGETRTATSGSRADLHPVSAQIPVITGTLPRIDPDADRDADPWAGASGVDSDSRPAPERSDGPASVGAAWRDPRTVLVGLFVLGMALTEGAANDWVALAITDGYSAPAYLGAVGYGIFVAAMTTGRLSGTWLIDRFGRLAVLRTACLLALAGLGVFVVSPWLPLGMAALFLWGLGASLGFPVGMSAAADDPQRAAANVSVVSTIGYGAFLGGPPLLGLLGEWVGVRSALGFVMIFVVVSLLLVSRLRPLDTSVSGSAQGPSGAAG